MDRARYLFGKALGSRLPLVDGDVVAPGLDAPVTINRDRWGIPHIEAASTAGGWYGLGFCHGQDRSFQCESLLRLLRGTLSALIGKEGLPLDRLSRRIGFSRGNESQLASFDPEIRANIEAYVQGLNAGTTRGLPRKAHEFALLSSRPTPWTGNEVVGMVKLLSFMFSTNADSELARLKILLADGPEALAAVDPGYGPSERELAAGLAPAVDCLSEDLEAFSHLVGRGGASNSWALSGSRTATGRPILANDPHLPALLPSVWYLAHVKTPEWSVAGAGLVGGPVIEVGHNGHSAWGITAALFDNVDLFQEELGPDGASVRQGDGFVPCEVIEERIEVRLGRAVTEKVVITPRGPVVGPAIDESVGALSLTALWLRGMPVEGFFLVHRTNSFDGFRRLFAAWPAPDLNVTYADAGGTIGWQLAGMAPVRRKGWGTVPQPGWDPDAGWEADPVPFDRMPHLADPESGFVATANTQPPAGLEQPFLGVDWIDGYRLARITEELASRSDWDLDSCARLQLDDLSLPWRDMRELVLAVPAGNADTRTALDLLAAWDGRISVEAPGATVFEFFVAEMARRVAAAKAPRSAGWVLGRGFGQLLPYTSFSFRRVGHLVELMKAAPEGWFGRSWEQEIAAALAVVVAGLRAARGPDPAAWAWGEVRPVELKHPVGERKPLNRVFNLGPFPFRGDTNTVAQTSVDPILATNDPGFVASLRMVADVGNWDACRWVIPAGQSGNPASPHYDDLLPLWRDGKGVPIPWSAGAVEEATVATLKLVPPAGG